MNAYEQKRADRAARLRSKAASLAAEADSRMAANRAKGEVMMGKRRVGASNGHRQGDEQVSHTDVTQRTNVTSRLFAVRKP